MQDNKNLVSYVSREQVKPDLNLQLSFTNPYEIFSIQTGLAPSYTTWMHSQKQRGSKETSKKPTRLIV